MQPKPAHLAQQYGDQFSDVSVVAAYHLRPPYPAATIARLAEAAGPEGAILDLGCGTGEIARPIRPLVGRVDAVDPSAAMIATGQVLPDGDVPGLRWIVGRAEDAPLSPPYNLVVAAASLHWMDWPIVLPRLRAALAPGARLAIAGVANAPVPWRDDAQVVIDRYSTNRDYHPYNLVDELVKRGLFHPLTTHRTDPAPFHQSIEDYVESYHARNGFSRDRMPAADAIAFARELTDVVRPFATDGMLELDIFGTITFGIPAPTSADLAAADGQ
ncbi:MAG TPA: class I SAM-dependent methyltransferase [Thermomicrobiales bacterium]|jgi:SAM-dependent methyltransferase|nr:class I SAM-dependent methyltransferase [Thermomicrobiales bacterium]